MHYAPIICFHPLPGGGGGRQPWEHLQQMSNWQAFNSKWLLLSQAIWQTWIQWWQIVCQQSRSKMLCDHQTHWQLTVSKHIQSNPLIIVLKYGKSSKNAFSGCMDVKIFAGLDSCTKNYVNIFALYILKISGNVFENQVKMPYTPSPTKLNPLLCPLWIFKFSIFLHLKKNGTLPVLTIDQ